jgi:DNA-binding transcriptional regulator GbsR (MarR family)
MATTPSDTARFVERFGSALTAAGMARLPGRVFACLLADRDGRMTAAELGVELGVSPASVSGAVRYLQQVHLIHREREPGTRRDVYVVADDDLFLLPCGSGMVFTNMTQDGYIPSAR